LIYSGVQIVPSGTNEFKKGDVADFYTEIYEPLLSNPDPQNPPAVAVEMRVLDRKTGGEAFNTGLGKIDIPTQGGSPVIPWGGRIPTDKLGPGSYTLELSALDTANNEFKRTADFELR
jgi:hypothetical protein